MLFCFSLYIYAMLQRHFFSGSSEIAFLLLRVFFLILETHFQLFLAKNLCASSKERQFARVCMADEPKQSRLKAVLRAELFEVPQLARASINKSSSEHFSCQKAAVFYHRPQANQQSIHID